MNTKDILTITTVALGTATWTVAAFWAGPIEAGSDADTPPAKIAKSRFLSHAVELTLSPAAGQVFKAGDQPGQIEQKIEIETDLGKGGSAQCVANATIKR